jgi:hypothetical protein
MVMPRRLLMGAATALAVAAFVVMPAAAQAAKYYRSGALIAEGEKVPIVQWGTLTSACEPCLAPITTCAYAAAGFVENGAETGEGATTTFAAYNCVNAGCPPGKIKVEGGEYEKEFSVTATKLPWPNALIEEEGIRVNSTGTQISLGCVAHGLSNTSPPGGTEIGQPGAQEPFYLALPTVCVATPESQQKPLAVNGKNTTVTSSLQFDAKAGSLRCAGGAVLDKTAGKLKVMGYKESELITAK